MNKESLLNIPKELREPALWLKSSKDKKPAQTFKTDADKAAHCRTLEHLVAKPDVVLVQRVVMKKENLIFIDLDHVHNTETDETEPWALNLIESLNSYTERSLSGSGYHIVCRGTLPEDFNLGPPSQVEVWSGNQQNKLMLMTGDVYDMHFTV